MTALQFAGGLFCAALGALMLVTPHQFGSPAYAVLQARLPAWGTLFLLAGSALIAVAALRPARWMRIVAHSLGAAVLLLLAWGFIPAGAIRASVAYSVLGVGILLAPFVPARKLHRTRAADRDLFTLVIGSAAALIGSFVLFGDAQFGVGPALLRYLPLFAAAYIIGGLALVATQLIDAPPAWLTWFAHFLVATVFISWMVSASLPNRTWTGILFYGGFGLLIAVMPWLRSRLVHLDPRSLRTRLALALVTIAAIPVIAATALVSEQQQRALLSQELASQQTLSRALAQDVSDYIILHRAAVRALAAVPDLLDLTEDELNELLREFHAAYPDVTSFTVFDADGNPIERSDSRQERSASDRPWFQQVRRTRQAATFVFMSPIIDRPIFTFVEPLLAEDGTFLGVTGAALRSTSVATLLAETAGSFNGRAYLVNESGQAIAHPDLDVVANLGDLSGTAPVAALLANDSGSLVYDAPDGETLAGFAEVPELGWGVIVERPVASVLATTRAGQEIAFVLLLVGVAISILIANITARRLAAPLAELARATRTLSLEGNSTPLPRTALSEIAVLTAVFSQMRERLTAQADEREEARNALLASNQRTVDILESINDVFYTLDHEWRFTYVNRVAEREWGLPREDLIGKNHWEVFPQVVDTEPYFALHKAAQERRSLQFEVFSPVVLKWIDVNVYPTHDGLSIYWQNITERKRAEEQVRQLNVELEGRVQERTADLVAINQELEAFNYSVSHDLRTPLRGINGFSEALLEEYGDKLDDNGRRYLGRISVAAERMGDIIDDLLKLSRLSRSEMSFKQVDLGELVRRITEDLRAQDPQRTVIVEIAEGVEVQADSTLITIALENLLENAWKFTRQQEHACIEFGVVHEPEREVYFVRDNGAGFDMKYAEKLFMAFQRLHTPAEYEGTGIGLATVQRIIHRHGGRIWAKSEPGAGAAFYFTLASKVEVRGT